MMEERYPNIKEEVGGLIPRCEISSLLDIILARWSIDSFALALACWAYVSRKKPKKKPKLETYRPLCPPNSSENVEST